MEYLSVSEYAKFKGCSERYIRKLISDGKLIAEERTEVARGGLSGISYMIPLAACELKVQKKYIKRQKKTEPTAAGAEAKAAGDHAGGDEPGGAAGSCQVEEHP